MRALLILMYLAAPARAGVAVSAEAGADASVPRISLQTTLSPLAGPSLTASLAPTAIAPLAAPSAPTPMGLPVPLAVSAVAGMPAAATPEAPKPAAAAAAAPEAAEPGAPTFKVKILGMLRSMANPFGGKSAEEAPAANEAERLDREFARHDPWTKAAPAARAEIEGLRAKKLSKAAMKDYVRHEAEAALERIKAARGVANIGFHYNLHGGARSQYVNEGIHATMGDIALQYSTHGDRNLKVYFFQSSKHRLYDLLNESHPQQLFLPSRMGSALNVFNLDAPALKAARADGRIRSESAVSMDFHGMRGVPYSAYLAPPLEVFHGTAKKVGLRRLSRDEETLATVRYLESALVTGGAFVPEGQNASAREIERSDAARARAAAAAGPANRIFPHFKLVDDAYYYHGTTLDDLARIVDNGGLMTPEVSQFSQRSRDSVEYAAERRRRLARSGNPEVLLQFPGAALDPLVSSEVFRAALTVTDRGMPPIHAAYVAATEPVPLSLMTPASKATILAWLRAHDDPRLPRFEAAFSAPAPKRRSQPAVAAPVIAAPTPEAVTLTTRLLRRLRTLGDWVSPPLLRSLYDDNSRAHYYHGLSLATLESVIDGGGSLAANQTYISDEAGHPYGYARSSARRTGTPGVVLQFEKSKLDPLIVPGHYNPRAPERGEKWADVPHWYMASSDLPLSAQTELSKKTVLTWLAEQRDAHPEDPSWPGRIAKFEAAFGLATPAK